MQARVAMVSKEETVLNEQSGRDPRNCQSIAEVVVTKPRELEEMPQVIQLLQEYKSVLLNLTMMEPEQAQRAVDFIAGATYAIDGHQERVGEMVFLFTPTFIRITTTPSTFDTPRSKDAEIPSSTSPLTLAPCVTNAEVVLSLSVDFRCAPP